MKFTAVCKKIIEIGPTGPEISYIEVEKLSKFYDFFLIYFIFTVKNGFWLQIQKSFVRMTFFILKLKVAYLSTTASFCSVADFVKTGKSAKWSKKNKFSRKEG